MLILDILCGIVAICIGVFAKEFYEGDALTISSYKRERRVSTWWGRVVFILVGVIFLASAVLSLMTGQPIGDK
jgi:hypothetical protein